MTAPSTIVRIALLVFILAPTARATSMVRVSIEQLAKRADRIVRVKCGASVVKPAREGTRIRTETTVDVLETLKGDRATRLTIICRGGRIGTRELIVRGQPRFKKGDECVLFLRKDKQGNWRVLGLNQGRFHITRDRKTRKVTASQSLDGLAFGFVDPKEDAPKKADLLPLTTLIERVGVVVERQRRKKAESGASDD